MLQFLESKETEWVNPKGNQSWIFIGEPDAEVEGPILRPPDAKNRLIGKDPDVGKHWGQEEKEGAEDEVVGWHHQLNGNEFEQAPGVGDGQEAWRAAVHGVTKSQTRLSDWTELNQFQYSGLENSMDCTVHQSGHKELDTTEQISLT